MTVYVKILVVLLALILQIFFIQNLWIPAAMIIFFLLLTLFRQSFLLIFVVVSFLTLTSTIDVQLRLVVQLVNLFLLFYYFIKEQPKGDITLKPAPKNLMLYLAGFILLMIVSTLFSSYKQDGFEQVLRIIVFLVIMYLIFFQIRSQKDVKLLLYSLTSVALIYSGYLLYELYLNDFAFISVKQQLTYVYGGEYLNKNFLGGFISIMIIMLVSFLFKPGVNKFGTFTLIAILSAGVILTNSRAALLSLFVSVIVILYMYNKKLLIKILSVFILLLLLLLVTPLSDLIMVYVRLENVTTGRDYLVESAVEVIKNNFIFGAGPAGTRHEMYEHLLYMFGSPEEMFLRRSYGLSDIGQAHSFYLFLFSDLGLPGLLFSILLPVIYFKSAIKCLRYYTVQNTFEFHLIQGIFVIGIFMFFRGLFEWGGVFTYGSINHDLPFWIIISILSYYYLKIPSAVTAENQMHENSEGI